MKTNKFAAYAAAILMVTSLGSSGVKAASTEPSVPVGTLTAFPTVVQTGTKPTLTWGITYPNVVTDVVTITPTTTSGGSTTTVTPKVNLVADIRVLGAGVTSQDSRGNIIYYRTQGKIKYNGSSSYSVIFDGKQTDSIVQTQGILPLFTGIAVNRNQPMYFGGCYNIDNTSKSNNWYTFFNSESGGNVKALVNGDSCPNYKTEYNAPTLESFLKPYMDGSNKIKIGPMDVIIFMELTTTNTKDAGYDFQDLVFLVTFRAQ